MKTYKRNQVEQAIWQVMAHQKGHSQKPPKKFSTRIKRLLELDRSHEDGPYAFSNAKPLGRGADVAFAPSDAFILALGMELLDSGYKQAEIVFLLRHIRPELKKAFSLIEKNPSPLRSIAAAEDYPELPSYQVNELEVADFRIFAIIEKIEIDEIYIETKKTDIPLILKPLFCLGIKALQKELNTRGWSFRKAMIVELSTIGTQVAQYLGEIPATRRGKN